MRSHIAVTLMILTQHVQHFWNDYDDDLMIPAYVCPYSGSWPWLRAQLPRQSRRLLPVRLQENVRHHGYHDVKLLPTSLTHHWDHHEAQLSGRAWSKSLLCCITGTCDVILASAIVCSVLVDNNVVMTTIHVHHLHAKCHTYINLLF